MKQTNYIGQMASRIEIQQFATSYSDTGHEQIVWSTLYVCWAKVDFPATGNDEGFLGDQQVAVTRVNFTVHRRDGLNEKMRILYKAQYHDIRNITETADRMYNVILTEKRI